MATESEWQYATLWEFQVRPGCEAQFERAYGPNGDWVTLFQSDENYVRTDLMRDDSNPFRYVTVDYWRSRAAYEAFRERHSQEYQRIDKGCEQMTDSETALGTFQRVAGKVTA
jgi:quinol monooxygenase YgiN